MINIIAIRGFIGDNGKIISIGDTLSVSDAFAKQLIKAGKAKEFIEPVEKTTTNIVHELNDIPNDNNDALDNHIESNHDSLNPHKDDENNEDNIVVNTNDDDNILNQDNVTDIDIQNPETQNNTDIVPQRPKTPEVIVQKNTAGKK